MSENKSSANSADQPRDAMWVKIGDGHWYAIPPKMAESFRKVGTEVSWNEPTGDSAG